MGKDKSEQRDCSGGLDSISLKDLQYRLCHAILGNIIQSMHEKANVDDKILSYESLYRTFESDGFSRNWVTSKSDSPVVADATPVIPEERKGSFDSSVENNVDRTVESGLCESDTVKSITWLSEFVKNATTDKNPAIAASIRDQVDENQIRR